MLLLPVVHTTTVIVLQFTLLPSPLFPLESLLLLPLPHHIFRDSSPTPSQTKHAYRKPPVQALEESYQHWQKCVEAPSGLSLGMTKINKHSTISPFSDHSNWPSHPFPLVLSLYRALLISYSFFSAACPHWPSYPSRPADGELGIHLPSGWAVESEKMNYS